MLEGGNFRVTAFVALLAGGVSEGASIPYNIKQSISARRGIHDEDICCLTTVSSGIYRNTTI